jgi:hypothetical protein
MSSHPIPDRPIMLKRSSGTAAIRLIAGVDIRRRWPTIVVLALIVGLVGAVALAIVAGARRTSASLGAFEQQSRSADVELNVIGQPTRTQLGRLRSAHGVEAIGALRAYGVVLPGDPDLQEIGTPFAHFGSSVDRARLVAGHFANPATADEVTIGESLANRLHVWVGGHLDIESYSPEQVSAIERGTVDVGSYSGPRLRLQIVGIDRRPLDLGDQAESGGLLVLTPAFARAYSHRIGIFGSHLRVRTYRGEADVPRVIASARKLFHGSLLSTQGLVVEKDGARSAINVSAVALWVTAGVAVLAGAAIIAIGLSRDADEIRSREETLRSLGLTRRQQVMTRMPFDLLIAGCGAVLAVIGSVALSPLFPFGVARRADPEVGLHADPIVLVSGVALLVVVVILIGIGTGFRAIFRSRHDTTKRSLSFAERMAHAGLSPAASNGTRMAFESSADGSAAVPVRSAHLVSIFGVLALTGALLFTANISSLVSSPDHFGWTWDFETADTSANNTLCGGTSYGLTQERGLASISEICLQNIQLEGRPEAGLAFSSLRGPEILPKIIAGRRPRGPREVALGSATLRELGKRIGDTVSARGLRAAFTYKIVGQTVLPSFGQAQPIDDGAVFTGSGFTPLFDPNIFTRYFVGTYSATAGRTQVARRIAEIPELSSPSGPTLPVEIARLEQIAWAPLGVAFLLGGLSLLAVGSTLVLGIRHNRRDLAILKTLGFRRGQVGSTIAWEATAFAVTGVVVGVPAGLVVGRVAWHAVATSLGIQTTVIVPSFTVALVAVGTLLIVNLVAILPARLASHMRPAEALRSE